MKNFSVKKIFGNPVTICVAVSLLSIIMAFSFQNTISVKNIVVGASFGNKICKKVAKGYGSFRASRVRAEMSALKSWSKKASKHGDLYGFWPNAESRTLYCGKRRGKSTIISCIAVAKPCMNKNVTAEKKKQRPKLQVSQIRYQ